MREEHRLWVFENRVLMSVFGPKRDEITGHQRRLHNEELHNSYVSLNIRVIKLRMQWAGHIACMRDRRNAYNILVWKPEGKRPLKRLKHRWENSSRTDLRVTGCKVVDLFHLVQDRDQWQAHVNMVMNLKVA
jgi:hypothetical protein